MDAADFFAMTGAVLTANALTLLLVYGIVQMSRDERSGSQPRLWLALTALVPMGFIAIAASYLS